MNKQETLTWQSGASDDTPPPPMVDLRDLVDRDQLFLKQYRKLGPVFRLPRPDKPPLTVLVGPQANVFVARYESGFFTTREHWEDFNTNIGGSSFSDVRNGQANRQRRAQSSKSWSRARVLDQLPRMIEITRDCSNWQPGESFVVRPAMQRIVAEQLGRLLVGFGPGEYLQDFITYLDMLITTSFGANRQWTPESRAIFEHAKERTQELLPLAVRLSVPILTGTDVVGTLAGEVAHLARFGLSPADAIAAATSWAYSFLKVVPNQPGILATFVTYQADPLGDPKVLQSPAAVVIGGVRVR